MRAILQRGKHSTVSLSLQVNHLSYRRTDTPGGKSQIAFLKTLLRTYSQKKREEVHPDCPGRRSGCFIGLWQPRPRYLSNPDGEGARREQTQKPDQRLWEVLHQHREERQAAKHHGQHGAHRAGKLGLLKQWRQHEGEKDLWNEMEWGQRRPRSYFWWLDCASHWAKRVCNTTKT